MVNLELISQHVEEEKLLTLLQLLVLHLKGIELLDKGHVFTAGGAGHQAVNLEQKGLEQDQQLAKGRQKLNTFTVPLSSVLTTEKRKLGWVRKGKGQI